jgi:AcrR family transcriptional regulator
MVMAVRYRTAIADASALTPDDWAFAAVRAIAEGGVDNVKVERLARRLGVTKGSFYWHFRNRAAVVAAAMALWERVATTDLIEKLERIEDPVARLRALFASTLADDADGSLDAALAARTDDPVVAPVVGRVTVARLAFLERCYGGMGLAPAVAAAQARVAYSTYLGYFQLRRSLPEDDLVGGPSPEYLDHLLAELGLG